MNGRMIAGVVGLIVLAFGLAGLVYPERVMHYAGFAVATTASLAQATAETRAIYGGLFVVLAGWILYATFARSGQLLVLAGTLFLGAALGRFGGAYVAGSPGLWGWIGAIVETALGIALLAAAWSIGRGDDRSDSRTPSAPDENGESSWEGPPGFLLGRPRAGEKVEGGGSPPGSVPPSPPTPGTTA